MPQVEFHVFKGLEPAAAAEILHQLPERTYAAGEVLLREDAPNHQMFLIEEGELKVWKGKPDTPQGVCVATLQAGNCFGEMSALNGDPSTATIVAAKTTMVRVLDLESLPATGVTRATVTGNLARTLVQRLSQATVSIQAKHESELNAMRLIASASAFLTRILTALSFYMFAMPLILFIKPLLASDSLISFFFITAFLWVVLDFMKRSQIKRENFCMQLDNWPRQVLMGVVWALPFMFGFFLVKVWLARQNPDTIQIFESTRAISSRADAGFGLWLFFAVTYAVLSFAQEFIRCAVQGTLDMISIPATASTHWKSILVSDVVFASIHMHLGSTFAFLAFIAGLVFGYQFWRARSYLTVATSHAAFGVWAIFIIGVPR